mgnify:CR=1 FL=1
MITNYLIVELQSVDYLRIKYMNGIPFSLDLSFLQFSFRIKPNSLWGR